jgi:hypothetical protein
MKAHFDVNKTRVVEAYMDRKIGRRSNRSFVNADIDGTIALKDHSEFQMEKSPGVLEIQLDKAKNSEDAYLTVKSMCEGIKSVVTK